MHTLTTALARRYGTVVVEDLDVAAMARSMSRRAFRRTVYQAGIGVIRPVLAYKTRWAGGQLVVADRLGHVLALAVAPACVLVLAVVLVLVLGFFWRASASWPSGKPSARLDRLLRKRLRTEGAM
jgi:hypothetical protein